jgi:uncharacterized coiled-coil protein SlyX
MARTFEVVNGKLQITETHPPTVRTINAAQFNRRINQLNNRVATIDSKIAELESEKASAEAILTELTPYIGQL